MLVALQKNSRGLRLYVEKNHCQMYKFVWDTKMSSYLSPIPLGVGVPGRAEATVNYMRLH